MMVRAAVGSLGAGLLLVAVLAPASMMSQAPDLEVTPAAAVVIDELQIGFTPLGPGWRDGRDGYAGHYYWSLASSRQSLVGIWRAPLDRAGRYRVLAWIPRSHATSRKAVYKIRTAGGWTVRVGNQWLRRGKWLNLGIHRLPTRAEVRLTDKTRDPRGTSRRLAFDAMQFVAIATPTPTPTPSPTPSLVPSPSPSLGPSPSAPPSPSLSLSPSPSAGASPSPGPS